MINQRSNFLDGLNLNAVAAAVAAGTWALPGVSPAFMAMQIFAPLPAFYYLVVLGQSGGLATLAAALLISGIFSVLIGQVAPFMVTLLILPIGLIMAREVLNKKSNPAQAGFKSLLVLLSMWLLWSFFYGQSATGVYDSLVTSLDAGLLEVGETLKGSTKLEPEQALEVEATISRMRGLLPRVMPGLLLITMLNTVFFNMVAGQFLLRRKDAGLVYWPPFAAWRLPEPLVAMVILAGFCLLLPMQIVKDFGLNLLLIAGTLYFFQGLALLTSLLNRWSVPGLLRVLIFLLLLIQAYGIVLLAVAGLVDVWTDLRRPRPKPEDNDEI